MDTVRETGDHRGQAAYPPGAIMRRLFILLCFVVAAGGAQADSVRFPKSGPHVFHVDLPKGWGQTTDKRGGLLLVAPGERALIYLGIEVNDKLRGQPDDAVAGALAKIAGIERVERQGAARISDAGGTRIHRGTAYSGLMSAKHHLARKAKIVIFRLSPNTWAQVWTVTQPGINAVEGNALNSVLNGITLTSGKK
jgi:hypothetical protein